MISYSALETGNVPCDNIDCRGYADYTCDGCGSPLCHDCARPLPRGLHACSGCWPIAVVTWPDRDSSPTTEDSASPAIPASDAGTIFTTEGAPR